MLESSTEFLRERSDSKPKNGSSEPPIEGGIGWAAGSHSPVT